MDILYKMRSHIPSKQLEDITEYCRNNPLLKEDDLIKSLFTTTIPFVKWKSNGAEYIDRPALADKIRTNSEYIFVRNGFSDKFCYWYSKGCYRLLNDDEIKGNIKKYITDYDSSLLKMSDVIEVFNNITSDLNYKTIYELNADENIINFQNGLLDLKTMELKPHTPDLLSTIQIPCNWDGQATETPVFDNYINTLTDGNQQTIKLLLQFIGATISNIKGWRFKKALFLVGNGNTGKSQLKALVERIIGNENISASSLEQIESRFGTAELFGKRLVGDSDMSFLDIKQLKIFKASTGGDSITAEFKRKDLFTFKFNGFLWFCCNKLPAFGGDRGQWVYDRIIVVNCPNVIPKDKQDKHLLDKLYEERQGIIAKCIFALKEIMESCCFEETEETKKAREQYVIQNSPVRQFFNDCVTERTPIGKIKDNCTAQKMYYAYKSYSKENGYYCTTSKKFRAEFSEITNQDFDNSTVVYNGYKYYKDYTLTSEAKENCGCYDSSTAE